MQPCRLLRLSLSFQLMQILALQAARQNPLKYTLLLKNITYKSHRPNCASNNTRQDISITYSTTLYVILCLPLTVLSNGFIFSKALPATVLLSGWIVGPRRMSG